MDCSTPGLPITNSQSLPKLMSIESVMTSNHLILCCPFLHLPSIFPSIRVFSNELAFSTDGQETGASASVLPMLKLQRLSLIQKIQVRPLSVTSETPNPHMSCLPLSQHLPLGHAPLQSASCSWGSPPAFFVGTTLVPGPSCLTQLQVLVNASYSWKTQASLSPGCSPDPQPLCTSVPHELVTSPLDQDTHLPPPSPRGHLGSRA